jgi:putative FmdB family regulatory protein
MPTYDYECSACGHRFDKFQSITAPAIRKCPRCGRRKVRRLIGSGAGIIFKGSGFYQTDYRGEAYRKAAEKDRPSGSDASSGESKGASDGGKADAGTSNGDS